MLRSGIPIGCGVLALALAGCGTSAKPRAGTIPPTATTIGRAKVDDPRTPHIKCLREHGFHVTEVGRTGFDVGRTRTLAQVRFQPTPGAAQGLQMQGGVQGAEVIDSALLYPGQASAGQLKTIEDCVAKGVGG